MSDRIDSLAKLLQSGQFSTSVFDTVSEITSILEAIPDRTRFLSALVATARRCFLSNHEAILSYHLPTKRWFVEASQDVADEALQELRGLSRTVIERTLKSNASLLINDAQTDEMLKGSKSVRLHNIQSVLTAPIFVNDELWGLIYLANTSIPKAFGEESRAQVESFARFAGMAIARCEEIVRFNAPSLEKKDESPALLEDVKSPVMQDVMSMVRKAAPSDAPILIQGETGTGKDVLAQWIHRKSPRRGKPLIQINCAELSPSLIELELFGVESGVATGVSFREGKIKIADGGTVFLNEIGELPLSMQAKLLRVIEERVVERLGGRTVLGIDVRFIFATNRDLASLVETGEFRRDLFYRINVFEVHVPTLEERREDIPALAEQILSRSCQMQNRTVPPFSSGSIEYLLNRRWGGNIRELSNLIERSLMLFSGEVLVIEGSGASNPRATAVQTSRPKASLKKAVAEFEIAHIRRFLEKEGWVEARAARAMGIPEGTLRSKMKKYKIARPRRLR